MINLDTGRDQLLLEGNDLFSASFASDGKVFFGSGKDGVASLYLLDLASGDVARVTNRTKDARQTFPSEAPRLTGGMVVYRADDENYRVPEPEPRDFARAPRFDAPRFVDTSPPPNLQNMGNVRLRRPNVQLGKNPPVKWYFDLDQRANVMDWNCQNSAYNGHQGTDFVQDVGYDVLAPASGEVIMRNDGCPDTKQVGCGGGYGNHVGIQHSDRSLSLEAHGKKWTVVPYGNYACAAKLMESASSGNSNAPHVHHESWVDKKKYDPFQGNCDPDQPSRWNKQNGYLDLPGTTCTH